MGVMSDGLDVMAKLVKQGVRDSGVVVGWPLEELGIQHDRRASVQACPAFLTRQVKHFPVKIEDVQCVPGEQFPLLLANPLKDFVGWCCCRQFHESTELVNLIRGW